MNIIKWKVPSIYLYAIIVSAIVGFCISLNPYIALLTLTTVGIGVLFFFLLFILKDKMISYLVVWLVISLFLIPSVSFGGMKLRLDDFLVVFITLGLFFNVLFKRQTTFEWVPLPFNTLTAYLGYSMMITIVSVIFGKIAPVYLLFFIKEIQYFLYLIACFYLVRNYAPFENKFKKGFIFVSIISILWGLYQLLSGNIRGYYGIGIISNQNPSQSGILFLIMTLMLLYFGVTSKKRIHEFTLTIGAFLSGIMTISTISRTGILGLGVVIFLYLGFSALKRKWNFKKIFISICFLVFAIPLGYKMIGTMVSSILNRFDRFGYSAGYRANNWKGFLSHSDTMGLIFGNGKGFMQEVVGGFTLKADNMYVRLLVEIGYVGLLLWAIFILSIIYYGLINIRRNYNEAVFLLILTLVFIIIGVTQEAYIVSIQGSAYWLLTGFFLGKISLQNMRRRNKND